jgi:sugar lactone lactonase YvrE
MDVATSEPLSLLPLGGPLLEGPVWVARDQALWFTDIKRQKIYRYAPHDGATQVWATWEAPEQVGFALPFEAGGFIAGLQNGLHRFDPERATFELIVDPEPKLPGNRLNDATVDPQGRLWFGTMDDGESAQTGAIYRLRADASCERETVMMPITNGPAFSPDGKTIYYADTLGGVLHTADVSAIGRLSNSREFATIPNSQGYPDGLTVDAEGCVWVGLYMGWEVRRYSPRGELLETVRFPCDAVTKIAFGGPELKTVYATTAAKHLTPEQRIDQPHAGNLFSFDVSVPGLPGVMIR